MGALNIEFKIPNLNVVHSSWIERVFNHALKIADRNQDQAC